MNATPEDVARTVRVEVAGVLRQAKLSAFAAATNALVEDGQPLAAYHVLRQSGLPDVEAFEVIEAAGAGGALLDLLLLTEITTSKRSRTA